MIGFSRDGTDIVASLERTEAQVFALVVAQVAGLIEFDRNAGGVDSELGANLDAELEELEAAEGRLDADPDADPALDAAPGHAADLGAVFDMGLDTMASSPDDPVLARLFPDGYLDDPEAAAELRALIQGDLHTQKLDHANTMLATLPLGGGEIRLDSGQAESWLLALNDARLVLGTRLEVTDDTDILDELDDAVRTDPTGPRVLALSVYDLLGHAQESLVEALAG